MPLQHPKIDPATFATCVLGISPYNKQVRTLLAVWKGYKTCLRAANGSGKTAIVVATLCLWFLDQYPRGRCCVTSGSWTQVERQLFYNLRCHAANPRFAGWHFGAVEVRTPQGGFIIGMSAADAGRVEGWHSTKESPVMFIADEAKTIKDPIFTAIDRCTIDYRLYCSSPGMAAGQFYRCFNEERQGFFPIVMQAADCPHIPESKIRDIIKRYGKESPLTRSMVYAEFTEGDGLLCLSPSDLRRALENPPGERDGTPYAFFDYAAGGDEDTVGICHGNTAFVAAAFRLQDTVQARRQQVKTAKEHGVVSGNAWGDGDGLGAAMLREQREEGYYVQEFRGGMPGTDPEHYANLISEVWIEGCLRIKRGEIRLKNVDPELFRQLTTRKQQLDNKGRLRIEPKEHMRAERGLHSPDRADALLGAIWAAFRAQNQWDTSPNIYIGGRTYTSEREYDWSGL